MARFLTLLAVLATIAALSLSLPTETKNNEIAAEIVDSNMMGEIDPVQLQNNLEDLQRAGGSLFNLTAYLFPSNRPAGTSLTFVPLITLLTGLLQGNVGG